MRELNQTKGELNKLRCDGWVPAVIYGKSMAPQNLSVSLKQFMKELQVPGIHTRVFRLNGFDLALVKDIQFPPTKDIPQHIDFLRLGDQVVVSVPLRFTHEIHSPGIKRGGILNVIHYTLSLSVSSHHIPHEIVVDLTGVDIGQTIHLKDLSLPEDARVLHVQKDEPIVSIVSPAGMSGAGEGNTEKTG